MIPTDPDELTVLAGEYVLGLLDSAQSREIETALARHGALREAVFFWERQLHPLSLLASPAEPPAGTWSAIAARLQPGAKAAPDWWNTAAPWRWSTAGFAAAAATLVLYLAVAPRAPAPVLVAALHAPNGEVASWVAIAGTGGFALTAVARENPPRGRVFELWGIAAHAARPTPLGVIPADGALRLASLPSSLRRGASLAISIEPPGGSPTGQPTGPVVFVGALHAT
jgi:anti-sigma-K factor RskA